MSEVQYIVIEILKNKILSGDESYYSVKQIHRMILDRGYEYDLKRLYKHLCTLTRLNYTEKIVGFIDKKKTSRESMYRYDKSNLGM